MSPTPRLRNFVDGAWTESRSERALDVHNPATGQVLCQVPLSTRSEVEVAIAAAQKALPGWSELPAAERAQCLYRLKRLVEGDLDGLSRTLTEECGKTLNEARGEFTRGIENIEVACGIPTLMQGALNEDIAPGIDEFMIRQPVGVVAAVTPFNFPAMIPLWFLPYGIACGNSFVLKPSERVPRTMARFFELVAKAGVPAGVLQLVNGDKDAVDVLLDHPAVRALSFVGSTPVARYLYRRGAEQGKRVQCQGGAKNPVVILPDADPEMTVRIVADSAFGCAGQRCLAASVVICVGDAHGPFRDALVKAARERKVGNGLDPSVHMGPVISPQSKARIEALIAQAERDGAKIPVDGRGVQVAGGEGGNFVGPTVLEDLPLHSDVTRTEIFGPVLTLLHMASLDDALAFINQNSFGNMACLFTQSGSAARAFRHRARAGNIGINLGVAAPMAYFPFTGWKDSFFGDLHAQGRDAIDFYTEKKVVIERWPAEWSRTF